MMITIKFLGTLFSKKTQSIFSTTKKMDIVECVFSIKSDVILRDLDFTIKNCSDQTIAFQAPGTKSSSKPRGARACRGSLAKLVQLSWTSRLGSWSPSGDQTRLENPQALVREFCQLNTSVLPATFDQRCILCIKGSIAIARRSINTHTADTTWRRSIRGIVSCVA